MFGDLAGVVDDERAHPVVPASTATMHVMVPTLHAPPLDGLGLVAARSLRPRHSPAQRGARPTVFFFEGPPNWKNSRREALTGT